MEEDTSYIDYEAFLSPSFSAHAFANTLITSTNDPSDPALDLSTPLSRVLFDLQEIDTHIHTLTTSAALPLLQHTASTAAASGSILAAVDAHVRALRTAYDRLHRHVTLRAHTANAVLEVTERLHAVTAQLRDLSHALVLARQLETQIAEADGDPGALVRAARTLSDLRAEGILGDDSDDAIDLVRDLKANVFKPAEAWVLAKARDAVATFEPAGSVNSAPQPQPAAQTGAFRELESLRVRAEAGALALWILSEGDEGEGRLLISAVQGVLNAAVSAALAQLVRSLSALTTMDRTVSDVAVRCQNLVALQTLLAGVVLDEDRKVALLDPVLELLDTKGLHTSFFRSVAAGLEAKIRDMVARGGANGRILRGAKERVRNALRACVERGLVGLEDGAGGRVEFEVAVMVGAAGALGR
ncbi:golgi transport complex component Cog5 [Geopyxis carbonaria]|nr:golgi transport complex component Cog5 [Geopyxis carbonaria]